MKNTQLLLINDMCGYGKGRAFRHAAGAVAYGLPHPQPANGARFRYA